MLAANLGLTWGHGMQDGNTALHLAAAGGHIWVVRELLANGADASAQNKVHCLRTLLD
jgi:ankyrin repeat protein